MLMGTLHKVPGFKVVGMEYYTAKNVKPLAESLADVARCDIYLLILAKRYGYVPLDDNPDNQLSITRQEYRKARELNKIILVFKAETRGNLFLPDTDDPEQPSAAQKAEWLAEFMKEVGKDVLSHPEGFTNPHHLALQVRESLVFSPKVDWDGDFPEERKIFCDRKAAVYDFYDLAQKKQPFSVFLIQGDRKASPDSLVERLSNYYLGVTQANLLRLSYYELLTDGSYSNFRRRLLNELCEKLQLSDLDQPADPTSILTEVKDRGTLAMLSSFRDSAQWSGGYQFLNDILLEFAAASAAVGSIRVYWFLVIDEPDALQQMLSVNITAAPPLTPVATRDVEKWIREYVVGDDDLVFSLQELCFPGTLSSGQLTMQEAQKQIRAFIHRFNMRRKVNDLELLNILR